MQPGEPLLVFNGTGWEYEAAIRQMPEGLALEIGARRAMSADGIEITLCQAIPKADRMEAIIRHTTELGVGRIIPFFAERSVPRWPPEKFTQKRQRWQKIAIEACRQCGRTDIPEIGEIVSLTDVLRSSHPGWLNVICWEEESVRGIRETLRDRGCDGIKGCQIVIGPEGGFGKNEIDQARQAGFVSVSMGKRVLRVDTAAVAVISILQYEKGALGGPEGGGPNVG
jgi:16S rRNA (uracil1498-N3)-methyltransferase